MENLYFPAITETEIFNVLSQTNETRITQLTDEMLTNPLCGNWNEGICEGNNTPCLENCIAKNRDSSDQGVCM
jgi:hypothetical protein